MPLVSMCGDEGVEKKKTGISQSWSRYEQPESSMSWVICTEDLLV